MLARLTAGQHDGDDDFGGYVKTMVLFIAASRPKFTQFWDNVGGHFVVSNAISRLCTSCSLPEILALKVAIELQSRQK